MWRFKRTPDGINFGNQKWREPDPERDGTRVERELATVVDGSLGIISDSDSNSERGNVIASLTSLWTRPKGVDGKIDDGEKDIDRKKDKERIKEKDEGDEAPIEVRVRVRVWYVKYVVFHHNL
jgi:hypothetical protein